MLVIALTWTGMSMGAVAVALAVTGAAKGHVAVGIYAAAEWIKFVADVLGGIWISAVVDGSLAVAFTYWWWRGRPKGKGDKTARELGAKSYARVAALVGQMRPSPIPSPGGAS